jgi:conjugative relaxase-like TrwC/TraI family protein
VLSIGKLGQGQESYYLEAVAQGVEDYYTGVGEPPGRWVGSAARELGIGGAVDDDSLRAVLGGDHPRTGDPLAARHGGARVPGFDLTFSAPKSVSVLFGLSGDDLSAQICGDYMERHGSVARRGAGGAESVSGNGFVAAAFRHRSSRAGDPQLHTHVLVANMTKGSDGRWTALDGRRLYAHAKTAGYLYEAHLRVEMTRRLGVEWGPVRNGIADIKGIPQPVLRAFSRRRAEIDRALAERGERSAGAAQVAALDTRRAKDYEVEPAALVASWRARAREFGFEVERAKLTGRFNANEQRPIDVERITGELGSPRGLTRERASFTRRDVIQAVCERLPQGVDVARAERARGRLPCKRPRRGARDRRVRADARRRHPAGRWAGG